MTQPLSSDAMAILSALKPQESALSPKAQADLWVKLGIATFSIVMIGGFGLIMTEISRNGMATSANSEKIDILTENVTQLVIASQNMQGELTKRGGWMDGQDLYSEQSRLKDQEHDQRLTALEAKGD
ncbi:hypothetical protein [Pontixanthobacter sp.]|uniref:hypothetical protein n=1 Tax=Pontixanthobacter sp. TaxID=2792078 RepID=UPI003C7CD048